MPIRRYVNNLSTFAFSVAMSHPWPLLNVNRSLRRSLRQLGHRSSHARHSRAALVRLSVSLHSVASYERLPSVHLTVVMVGSAGRECDARHHHHQTEQATDHDEGDGGCGQTCRRVAGGAGRVGQGVRGRRGGVQEEVALFVDFASIDAHVLRVVTALHRVAVVLVVGVRASQEHCAVSAVGEAL